MTLFVIGTKSRPFDKTSEYVFEGINVPKPSSTLKGQSFLLEMARFKSIQAGGGRLALMNEDMSGCPKESRSGNPRNLRYENKVNEMPESYPWQTYLCYPGGDPGKKDNFVIEASNLTIYLLQSHQGHFWSTYASAEKSKWSI